MKLTTGDNKHVGESTTTKRPGPQVKNELGKTCEHITQVTRKPEHGKEEKHCEFFFFTLALGETIYQKKNILSIKFSLCVSCNTVKYCKVIVLLLPWGENVRPWQTPNFLSLTYFSLSIYVRDK